VAVKFLKAQPHYADSFWATCRSTRPSNHDFAAAMTSVSDENWRNFNCFIQSREQVVVRQSQIRRIGWVIKSLEAPVSQLLLGCKCPGSRGIVVQEQDPPWWLYRGSAFFLQNLLQLHQQRWVTFRVEFGPLEDNQWEWSQIIKPRII
jgi:hypothetical protein